jgi:hypothetical protein
LGPSFVLTSEEIAESSELPLERAEEGGGFERVGWYWSKPNGQLNVTAYDRSLFEALGPERWQVALLIRPSLSNVTVASFAIREPADGKNGIRLGVPHELIWQDPEVAEAVAASEPALVASIAPLPPIVPPPPIAPLPPIAPVRPAPYIPVAMPIGGTLFAAPRVRRRRWPMVLSGLAVLLVLLWVLAFLVRSYWIPRPVIAMVASSDRAGRVDFLWNPDGFFWKPDAFWWNPAVLWNPEAVWNSGALNPEDSAVLMIDDGEGPLHIVHLNEAGLRGGWYQYDCRPGKVSAVLKAGNLSDGVTVTARGDTYLAENGISKK